MKKINVKSIIYVTVRDICPDRSFLGEKRERRIRGRGGGHHISCYPAFGFCRLQRASNTIVLGVVDVSYSSIALWVETIRLYLVWMGARRRVELVCVTTGVDFTMSMNSETKPQRTGMQLKLRINKTI